LFVHKYQFKLNIGDNAVTEFLLLFPVEGNEHAKDAVLHSKAFANEHLKSRNLKTLGDYQYTSEYVGTEKSDGFQEAQIKKSGYAFVPLNENNN